MLHKMNKRGGEKYLYFWLVINFIAIVVAVSIVLLLFYSMDLNAKEIEAQVLSMKISDCLIENGYLNDDVFNEDFNESDIIKDCRLDKSVLSDFYFNVSVYEDNKLNKNFNYGLGDLELRCKLMDEGIGLDVEPGCSTRKLYVLKNIPEGEDDKIIVLNVFAASNQEGK